MRIASLCPSNTELLCTLGIGDELIAVDNYSDTPAAVVKGLPRLGPDLHIDIDQLVSLSPDLVLSSLSVPGMEKVVAGVRQAGLSQLVLSSESLDDIFHDLLRIADAIGRNELSARADDITLALRHRVERIQAVTADLDVLPTLYWEWWPHPLFSPAQDNWLTELSRLAGARNLFADSPGSQVQDDGKRLLAGQPDFVLAVWTGVPQHKVPLQKILNRPEISGLSAIQKGQLYILSEGLYCRPSPRLIDGLEQLVRLIHPEVAERLQLPAATAHAPVRDMQGRWL